jgi:hypothetical protein
MLAPSEMTMDELGEGGIPFVASPAVNGKLLSESK